ncbi:MAG: serpin family protein [Bacteroidales bacterium]|nr:serpin family protein [Bacteroidales bacterium]
MKTSLCISTVCGMLLLTGCAQEDMNPKADMQLPEQSTTQTTASPDAGTPFKLYAPQAQAEPTDAQVAQAQRLNDFALRLFDVIRQDGKSLVFSPLSLGYALGMAALACDGTPLAELNAMLGLEADDTSTLHDLYATLMQYLPAADPNVSINVANAFYLNAARTDVKLNPDYRQALITNYLADCEALDFYEQASLDYINDWCNRQTNGFIPEVLKELNPTSISYLLNALYFKADWTCPFGTDFTREKDFIREDGKTVKVKMMSHGTSMRFPYAEDETMQVLCLPYARGSYYMTVLLPKTGHTIDDVLNSLTSNRLSGILTLPFLERYGPEVAVSMPRFETEETTNLVEPLKALGIPSWFGGGQIRGMVQNLDGTPHGVFVSNVFQKARIKVNEKGTEAAAVTIMEFTDGMPMDPPVAFTADHPFVYFISEPSSRTLLFVGTYHGEAEGGTGEENGIKDVKM